MKGDEVSMVEMTTTTTDAVTRVGSAERTWMASPWILGLYGLAGATFIVFAHLAGWFGDPQSVRLLWPLAAVLGGLVPLLAAMWAFAAGDGLATAMLGTWGAFWIGWGLLNRMPDAEKLLQPRGAFPELAYWLIALAAITWMGVAASTMVSRALATVLSVLAAASTLAAIGEGLGVHGLTVLAAWVFVAAAICAWYTSTGMMLAESFGREVLPLGLVRPEVQVRILRPAPTHRAG